MNERTTKTKKAEVNRLNPSTVDGTIQGIATVDRRNTAMPESEAKKRWMRENTKVYSVKVTKTTETDIIEYLEGKQPATEFKKGIRLLIEQEKKRHEEEQK